MPSSKFSRRQLLLGAAAFSGRLLATAGQAQVESPPAPIYSRDDRWHPVMGVAGMVASQEAIASRVGRSILAAGGNAVDAAVAIGLALAVTLPRAGNLGGGGFMLIHPAATRETIALDYREKAPLAASREMFLDAAGNADPEQSRDSHLAVGVPGTVAGFALALARYGTFTWAEVLQPAIALAEQGFPVSQDLHESLAFARARLSRSPASRAAFFKPDGSLYAIGETLVQPDLARTLRLLASEGPSAFYQGAIALAIADDMAANGGLITQADLARYQPVIRQPVRGRYRGYDIESMPPPSSGGVHLVQMLNLLEPFQLANLGHNSAQTIHLMAESMKLAYADRSRYLGDPDFVPVPVAGLTARRYADQLRSRLNPYQATPSVAIAPGNPQAAQRFESNETTHYSVIDRAGNAVSNTYTLNFSYGTGWMVPGTGILLNNEMDDFSAQPGVPNAYGLIGGEFNAVEPEKRMLSSMTPTLVSRDGQIYFATGSPGGSRIITTVLQVVLNVLEHDLNLAVAAAAPRIHHQWLPDELRVESGLSADTLRLLARRGHTVIERATMGSVQSVGRVGDRFFGAADPRSPGALAIGL
ncbi:MAG: gamma-glutamyltransferase [Spirulinaceae cyanobacterium SM2_1_0]|nr:gamma-glutamyltransferase [Spirulinaceae cyanobacterium SM2_1_0]